MWTYLCIPGSALDCCDPLRTPNVSRSRIREALQPGGVWQRHARRVSVGDAMDDYFRSLESEGRSKHSIYDARRRDQGFIRPDLGNLKVAALTPDRLRRWRDGPVNTAPRLRTRAGEAQKHRQFVAGQDQRARRTTAKSNLDGSARSTQSCV